MKFKFLKQSVSMLMAVLTIISVLTVSVSAEELLPEECGGAICVTDETAAMESVFDESASTDVNCDDAIDNGGAIYTSSELTRTEISFTSHENTDPGDVGAIDNGGAIYTSSEIIMTGTTFTGYANTDPGDGDAVYNSSENTDLENTFDGFVDAEPADGSAANINISTVPVQSEATDESQLNGETPRDVEILEPPADTETPEQTECFPDISENICIPEALVTAEIPDNSNGVQSDGTIYNSVDTIIPDVTKDSDVSTLDDSAASINVSTVPVQSETTGEPQLNVEIPQDVEILEPPADTETPEQAECFPDSSENICIPEASVTAEIPDNSTIDPISMVAGIDIVGKVVPHPQPNDPEIEELKGKNYKITQTIGDAVIKIGESVIPFGHTISNFIRSRSPQAKDMDGAETAIDLVADTAAYAFPIAAPLVSVAKDIALKIRRLFQ